VEYLIAEGKLIETSSGGGDNTNYFYQYENELTIWYKEQNHDGTLYVIKLEWMSDKIKTFNGLQVGTSQKL